MWFDSINRQKGEIGVSRKQLAKLWLFRSFGESGIVELETYLKKPLPERVKVFK